LSWLPQLNQSISINQYQSISSGTVERYFNNHTSQLDPQKIKVAFSLLPSSEKSSNHSLDGDGASSVIYHALVRFYFTPLGLGLGLGFGLLVLPKLVWWLSPEYLS